MLAFILYFVTAVFTGYHLYTLMSLVVYGVPVNPLELVGFLGSIGLLIAAYISLFRPRAGGRVALIACLALWCFYAPAIANFIRARVHKPVSVTEMMSHRVDKVRVVMATVESAKSE